METLGLFSFYIFENKFAKLTAPIMRGNDKIYFSHYVRSIMYAVKF